MDNIDSKMSLFCIHQATLCKSTLQSVCLAVLLTIGIIHVEYVVYIIYVLMNLTLIVAGTIASHVMSVGCQCPKSSEAEKEKFLALNGLWSPSARKSHAHTHTHTDGQVYITLAYLDMFCRQLRIYLVMMAAVVATTALLGSSVT